MTGQRFCVAWVWKLNENVNTHWDSSTFIQSPLALTNIVKNFLLFLRFWNSNFGNSTSLVILWLKTTTETHSTETQIQSHECKSGQQAENKWQRVVSRHFLCISTVFRWWWMLWFVCTYRMAHENCLWWNFATF